MTRFEKAMVSGGAAAALFAGVATAQFGLAPLHGPHDENGTELIVSDGATTDGQAAAPINSP